MSLISKVSTRSPAAIFSVPLRPAVRHFSRASTACKDSNQRSLALSQWPFGSLGFYNDPFTSDMERAIDRAFSRMAGSQGSRSSAVPNLFRTVAGGTPMDVHEDEKEYTITADAPGFEPSEISVEEHEGVLTVRGTKEKSIKTGKGNALRQERVYHSFTRSFTLPDTADESKIRAGLDNGVLTVHIPKLESAAAVHEPRRIPVAGAAMAPQIESSTDKSHGEGGDFEMVGASGGGGHQGQEQQ